MIVGRFDYVKSGLYDGIAYFRWCCKRRVGAYIVVIGCKYSFLIDHPDVGIFDGICDVGIDFVIIPGSVFGNACINKTLVIKIIANCNDRCCCYIAGSSFCLLFFFCCDSLFLGIYSWFSDQTVIQLVKQNDQNGQDSNRSQKTCPGIAALTEVQRNVFFKISLNSFPVFTRLPEILKPLRKI